MYDELQLEKNKLFNKPVSLVVGLVDTVQQSYEHSWICDCTVQRSPTGTRERELKQTI